SPFDVVATRFKIAIQVAKSLDQRPGQVVKQFTFRCKFESRAPPFEKGRAEFPFESLHLKGNCRLRQTQAGRGFRDASGFDGGAESAQLLKSVLFVAKDIHEY